MYTLVILGGGRQAEALLLSASADRLRIVMPGNADTLEFQFSGGGWLAEDGTSVELAVMLAASDTDALRVRGPVQMHIRAAG